MNNDKNIFDINGTLYSKNTKSVDKKDKPGEKWEFKSIILEIKTQSGSKTFTDLPEFQLANNVDHEGFDIGDFINVRFSITGKKINPNWHKSELRATYIKHADLQTKTPEENSFLNTETNRKPLKIDSPIAPPVPEELDGEDNFNDLPF
jgi:hypothetical protein